MQKLLLLKGGHKVLHVLYMMIVPYLLGKVIGKKGNTIQGIMEKSRVLNVKIMGDDEARKKNIDTKDKVLYLGRIIYHYSIL